MKAKEVERLINWGELPSPTESLKEGSEWAAKAPNGCGCSLGSCEEPPGNLEPLMTEEILNAQCKDCE